MDETTARPEMSPDICWVNEQWRALLYQDKLLAELQRKFQTTESWSMLWGELTTELLGLVMRLRSYHKDLQKRLDACPDSAALADLVQASHVLRVRAVDILSGPMPNENENEEASHAE